MLLGGGAERLFWNLSGVYVTAVGYNGGYTPNLVYDEVCSGLIGHTEVVLVVYNHEEVTLAALLKKFLEEHDPIQCMRQSNDTGSNYRSAIYLGNDADYRVAVESRKTYEQVLKAQGRGPVVNEIAVNQPFYYAEA